MPGNKFKLNVTTTDRDGCARSLVTAFRVKETHNKPLAIYYYDVCLESHRIEWTRKLKSPIMLF